MPAADQPSPSKLSSRPQGLTPLGKLAQAMNVEQLPSPNPPVLVTMDHRAVLVAAWAAQRQGLFPKPPLLFRLDAHPDMGERPRPWAYEKSLLTDLDSVTAVVNSTRIDDGGWVIPAMQWGFCDSVYSAFVHEYHRFEGDSSPYRDAFGDEHALFTSSDFTGAFERFQRARNREPNRPVWVDIDLDFATTRNENGSPCPWSAQEWERTFPAEQLKQFAEIAAGASLVTLCLEPWFCGGVEACGKIARQFEDRLSPYTTVFTGLA